MIALTYTHANDLNQLHDELIAAGTACAPKTAEDGTLYSDCQVTADGDQITIYVPDDTTQAQQDAIAQVVAAHVPQPAAAPAPTVSEGAAQLLDDLAAGRITQKAALQQALELLASNAV